MNVSEYKKYLSSHGNSLGNIKRNQSDILMNSTFTRDPAYKKVYILTKDGWKWEDAKYQEHSVQSIAKDPVDYYLQFRPKVHYSVGSYVIVPDDTSPELNLNSEELLNPFLQPAKNRTQWWIIVGRDESNDYVKYMILKCNWDYRWVYKGKLMSCWGCARNSQSYTAGVWRDDISQSLDDLNALWIPDNYFVYGDALESLGMDDTRTIMYGQRFMLTNNVLNPKVYEVTKIVELSPQGVLKLSVKQGEFNEKRDNLDLRVCDYYTDEGEILVDKKDTFVSGNTMTSEINWMFVNENGELDSNDGFNNEILNIGHVSYFKASFSDNTVDGQWRIKLINDEDLNESDVKYYEGLMKLTKFDRTTLALQPAKASSLKGRRFILSVSDENGDYESSIEVGVSE